MIDYCDYCGNCDLKGNISACLVAKCGIHDNWVVNQLCKEVSKLNDHLTEKVAQVKSETDSRKYWMEKAVIGQVDNRIETDKLRGELKLEKDSRKFWSDQHLNVSLEIMKLREELNNVKESLKEAIDYAAFWGINPQKDIVINKWRKTAGIKNPDDEDEVVKDVAKTPVLAGYWSNEAINHGCPSFIYETPYGGTLEVTAVFKDIQTGVDWYKWKDSAYLGPVTKFVKRGRGENLPW
jgi:hypothetical protein